MSKHFSFKKVSPICFLLGCLHELGGNDPLYITLHNLAEQYGDIFSLYIGNRLTVVLSSKEAIYEALIKIAKAFSGRPDIPSMNVGSDGSAGIAKANDNEQYRRNKLMVVRGFQNLFSDQKLLDTLIHKEIVKMLHLFDNLALNSSSFCPIDYFLLISSGTMLSTLFGDNVGYTNPELVQLVKQNNEQFEEETANPMDFLDYHILKVLPNTCLDKLRKGRKSRIQFANRKITSYLQNREETHSSLLNSYFVNFHKDLIVEVISAREIHEMALLLSDLQEECFDTVATTLSWSMLYLVQYPAITKRCRHEITTLVGRNDLSIEHECFLPYYIATIYDILRLSSVGPLGIPHATIQDVTLREFEIPRNTVIITNIWTVNHNPEEWEKPNELYPEHHLNSQGKINPSAIKNIATFSSGIRRCPGDKFAFYQLFLFLGTIIKTYDIKMMTPPEDMVPRQGFTVKPKPYTIALSRC